MRRIVDTSHPDWWAWLEMPGRQKIKLYASNRHQTSAGIFQDPFEDKHYTSLMMFLLEATFSFQPAPALQFSAVIFKDIYIYIYCVYIYICIVYIYIYVLCILYIYVLCILYIYVLCIYIYMYCVYYIYVLCIYK